jgi:hypothetical protein
MALPEKEKDFSRNRPALVSARREKVLSSQDFDAIPHIRRRAQAMQGQKSLPNDAGTVTLIAIIGIIGKV